jgi:hypothetical protein
VEQPGKCGRGERQGEGQPPKRLPLDPGYAPYTAENVKLTVTFLQPFWLVPLSIIASDPPDGENVLVPAGRSVAIEFGCTNVKSAAEQPTAATPGEVSIDAIE